MPCHPCLAPFQAADLIAAQPNDFMGVVTEPKVGTPQFQMLQDYSIRTKVIGLFWSYCFFFFGTLHNNRCQQVCQSMSSTCRCQESPNGPNEVDWELHAWTEVSLDSFKDLSDQLKESLVLVLSAPATGNPLGEPPWDPLQTLVGPPWDPLGVDQNASPLSFIDLARRLRTWKRKTRMSESRRTSPARKSAIGKPCVFSCATSCSRKHFKAWPLNLLICCLNHQSSQWLNCRG